MRYRTTPISTIPTVRSRQTVLHVVLLIFAVAMLLIAPVLSAQSAPIWYGASIGGAGARLTCDVCQTTRDVGAALSVSAGTYRNPRLRLGIELSRWSYEENEVQEQVHTLGVVAHVIPNPQRGFYLLGGAGWSGYRAGEFTYDAPRLTVGAGWDLPVTDRFVIGNVVALDAASFASLRNEEQVVVRDVGLSSVRIAVQLRRQ